MYLKNEEKFDLNIVKSELITYLKENGVKEDRIDKLFEIIKSYDEEDMILIFNSHFCFINDDIVEEVEDCIKNIHTLEECYCVYRGYKTKGDWAKAYNYEYGFLEIFSYDELSEYFDEDSKQNLLKYIKYNIDLGELENQVDDMELSDIFNRLSNMDLLSEELSEIISLFIDWESLIHKIVNGNFIVSHWYEDIIIVESYPLN